MSELEKLTKEGIIAKYPPKPEPFKDKDGTEFTPMVSRDEEGLIRYIVPGWGRNRVAVTEKEGEK